ASPYLTCRKPPGPLAGPAPCLTQESAMRRTLILAALCSLGLTAVAHAGRIPIDQLKFPIPRDHKVRVDFPVGEFRIESTSGTSIEFELSAKCKGSSWHCE